VSEDQTQNLIAGCADQAVADRRAIAITQAVGQLSGADVAFWRAKAGDVLIAYLHAAAVSGAGMADVARWVSGADPDAPENVLHRSGACERAQVLAGMRSTSKTAATVRMVMSLALQRWQRARQEVGQ